VQVQLSFRHRDWRMKNSIALRTESEMASKKKTSTPLFITPLSLFSVYHLHPSLPFSAYPMELNSLFSALHMDQ
jgi:hypothetical protein